MPKKRLSLLPIARTSALLLDCAFKLLVCLFLWQQSHLMAVLCHLASASIVFCFRSFQEHKFFWGGLLNLFLPAVPNSVAYSAFFASLGFFCCLRLKHGLFMLTQGQLPKLLLIVHDVLAACHDRAFIFVKSRMRLVSGGTKKASTRSVGRVHREERLSIALLFRSLWNPLRLLFVGPGSSKIWGEGQNLGTAYVLISKG